MVDIFTQLNQGLDVLKKMDCPDPEVYNDMMKRFTKVSRLEKDFYHSFYMIVCSRLDHQ